MCAGGDLGTRCSQTLGDCVSGSAGEFCQLEGPGCCTGTVGDFISMFEQQQILAMRANGTPISIQKANIEWFTCRLYGGSILQVGESGEKAGLKKWDIITHINGREASPKVLRKLHSNSNPYKMSFVRPETEERFEITVNPTRVKSFLSF